MATSDAVGAVTRRLDLIRWCALRQSIEEWKREWNRPASAEWPVPIRLSDGRVMEIDDGVPDTRADCPTVKPCPHIRCRHHLWRIDGGADGTRAGRPGLSAVPRNARGLTLPVVGDMNGDRPGTTLEARWLKDPVPSSCALDEIEACGRPMSNEEIGKHIGRHRTLTRRIIGTAFNEAKETAERMFGMTESDLLAGLRELGAGRT